MCVDQSGGVGCCTLHKSRPISCPALEGIWNVSLSWRWEIQASMRLYGLLQLSPYCLHALPFARSLRSDWPGTLPTCYMSSRSA